MATMKKKELEIALQKIPGMKSPSPLLEQYQTPAGIAADILFNAYDDINGKAVVDLGCGTGIFCIGASLLGAREVTGVDIDASAIEIAEEESKRMGAENITFMANSVENISVEGDTVIMNPPFGSQLGNRRADRAFLKKGLEVAPVIYSIHLENTIPFIKILISSLDGEVTYSKSYPFPIKRIFSFHRKKVAVYEVMLLRISRRQKRMR